MLARRRESILLVNVDNKTLKAFLDTPKAMEGLQKIKGFRSLNKDLRTIINRSKVLKKAKKNAPDSIGKAEKN